MRRVLAILLLGCVLAGCRSDAPRRTEASTAAPAHARRRYAVLINADTAGHHRRNISRAYRTLLALGFAERDVFVLSPRDRRNPPRKDTPVLKPFPENLADVLDRLEDSVVPGDLVVIYGTGHGDTEQGESLLELRHGELYSGDLRAEVDRLRGDTVIVMDQCFSGGFADALKGTRSRVLMVDTVDAAHETSCVVFARAFWDAFLHPEKADRNHDGKTSVREAFQLAIGAHRKDLDGDPDLGSNGNCRSFNGLDDAVLN